MSTPAVLTTRQRDLLTFIYSYWVTNRIGPRLCDMAGELDVTTTTVHGHLQLLAEKGCVTRERMASRGVRVTKRGRSVLGLREGQTPMHALRRAWSLASKKDRKAFLKEVKRK